jgi:hypothetical protein
VFVEGGQTGKANVLIFECHCFFKSQDVEAMILENHTISAKDSTERRNPLLSLVCV